MTKEDKPDAWMPLYIGDWDGDTGHLDCEQDGAYGRLVRHYWRNGPLPDDDAALARVVRMELKRWRKVRPVLVAFFVVKDGRWTHKRVDAEIARWSGKKAAAVEKAREAAKKRWKKDASGNAPSNASGNQQALLEQCPSSSSGKVDGPTGQSTLSGRDRSEALPEGASGVATESLEERKARADEVRRSMGILRVVGE